MTQDAADVLGADLGQAVISNAATQILLRQAPQAIDAVGDAFGLTAGERRLLLTARRGQGLLLSGTHRTGFEAIASSAEDALATTDPGFDNSEGLDALNLKPRLPERTSARCFSSGYRSSRCQGLKSRKVVSSDRCRL